MPYQDIQRFNPSYGNRYGFRQRDSAPSTGPVTQPVPGSPAAPPAPTASNSATRLNDYSGTSAESDGGENDLGYGNDDNRSKELAANTLGYGQGASGDLGALGSGIGLLTGIPGLGAAGNLADQNLAEIGKTNSSSNVYGQQANADIYGGNSLNNVARGAFHGAISYDPITGQQTSGQSNESAFGFGPIAPGAQQFGVSAASQAGLGTQRGFQSIADLTNRNVQGSAPSSLTGLADNEAAVGNPVGANAAQGYEGTHDSVRRIAQGNNISSHSVDPGSATANAISGVGYSDSGAAQSGSQFSSTGTFSSGDNNNNGSNEPSAPADPGLDAFSHDSGDSGGGGGGGK